MRALVRLYQRDLRETFRLSIPIVVAQLGVVLMGVTDNLMIGRLLGAVPLGAAGVAHSVTFLIGSIGIGGISIVSALVSKAYGQHDTAEIGHLFRAGIRVAWLLSGALGLLGLLVVWQFEFLQQTPAITQLARPFVLILLLSNAPLLVFMAIRQLCDGLSRPRVAMYITMSALVLNAFLNYALIRWLGLNGAALGTLLARGYMAVAIWLYTRQDNFFQPYLEVVAVPLKGLILKILRLGLPGGFQFFFEIAAFSLAVIMIGWLGEPQLAAHQIAINMASTTYMMATGISAAGSIRVGRALGLGSLPAVQRAGTAAFLLTAVFMSGCCLLFLSANEWLVSLYIRDNAQVAAIAASLMIIAGFFQLSDGIQVVGLGVLRGVSDVNLPTLFTFLAYWVLALPLSYVLAFPLGLDVVGVWIGLLVGLTVSALLLTVRFYRKLRRLRREGLKA
ncbi:MATE family efflux transporter [Rhabdobacter roseus]|uniref:Multidrug-efflux transporter n=1 Tax=Rhabdobacter roseus TaxID=1655419 RepID=A0A840TGM3_9BACT|nr:MATE family efflux transporter [Rhabdobacter roseus]MBB5282624.1 MATE family multidrug resistance protein [Rhabdobacter roseus]